MAFAAAIEKPAFPASGFDAGVPISVKLTGVRIEKYEPRLIAQRGRTFTELDDQGARQSVVRKHDPARRLSRNLDEYVTQGTLTTSVVPPNSDLRNAIHR